MDILVSSNLERLLWLVAGAGKTREYMKNLKEKGVFEVDADTLKVLQEDIYACFADEKDCHETIRKTFEEYNYLIDPHTAVGTFAAEKYMKETDSNNPMLVVSTASPFKFSPSVSRALGLSSGEGFDAMDRLSEYTGIDAPKALTGLRYEKADFLPWLSPNQWRKKLLNSPIKRYKLS